jgi:hypothetical protein
MNHLYHGDPTDVDHFLTIGKSERIYEFSGGPNHFVRASKSAGSGASPTHATSPMEVGDIDIENRAEIAS